MTTHNDKGDPCQQLLETGMRHHRAGQLAEAEQYYRRVLQHNPDHPDALHLLGYLASLANNHNAAIDLIRKAIALQPDNKSSPNTVARAHNRVLRLRRGISIISNYSRISCRICFS